MNQHWILDGFPMTLNQAQLLEEALTGYNRNLTELERKKAQKSTLAIDPATSKEVPLPSPAFDFVVLLDVSDTSSMSRMKDIIGKLDTFFGALFTMNTLFVLSISEYSHIQL